MRRGWNTYRPRRLLRALGIWGVVWGLFALGPPRVAWSATPDSIRIGIRPGDSIPPEAVTDLNAVPGASEGGIDLSWTAPAENLSPNPVFEPVARYTVYYGTISVADLANDTTAWRTHPLVTAVTVLPALPAGSAESFALGALPPTTHYFAIRSEDSSGNPSDIDVGAATPGLQASALPNAIPPAPVTDLAASPGAVTGSIDLAWTATGDDGLAGDIVNGRYRIDYSTDPAAPHLLDPSVFQVDFATTALAGSLQRRTVGGLTAGATYYVRLYTLDDVSSVSLSNAATAQARPDEVGGPPSVSSFNQSSVFPGVVNGAVPLDGFVALSFSETMNAPSVSAAYRLRAVRDSMGRAIDEPVAGAYSFDGQNLTFVPAAPLRGNYTYEVSLTTAAQDAGGTPLPAAYTSLFRTVFDRTAENVIIGDDDATEVRIPAGALDEDGFLQVSLDPLTASFDGLSGTIRDATAKERMRRGAKMSPIEGTLREFQLASAATGLDMTADNGRMIELSLPYQDPDGDGYVDVNGYKVHERYLGIATLNETDGLWVQVPGATVDTERNRVNVLVRHFSVYGVMPVTLTFVGDAYAYPVPFVPSQGHRQIVFTNLAEDTHVRIYTVSGSLVRELHETEGDGQALWDVKNDAGDDVVSGVYIYVITSGSEKKEGKLVVIR